MTIGVQSELQCPYVGLQPYAEEHRDYFFGRERERRIVVANLYATPLSVLYGASGVGKSSILQAGVAPDLRASPRTAVVYFNQWHDDSFLQQLKTQCVEAVAEATGRVAAVDEALPLDELLLTLQQGFGGAIVVLLDQFEEYFLYHPSEETSQSFESELARTVNRDDVRASFLIALRDDWLSRLDRFRGRIPNLLGNAIRLDHLRAAAAADAIRNPLAVWNERRATAAASIEDGLVSRIIRDVGTGRVTVSETAGLGEARTSADADRIETAFLQLVLLKLWEAERSEDAHTLRLETYERLGGASQIVQAHLNGLLNELSEADRETCARIFPFMVTPGGSKIAHETTDLVAFAERPRAETVALLERLTGQRVLRRITPPERYEIFHDVLAPTILDWRSRHVQARLVAQRESEERLRAEARSAKRLRSLLWIAGASAVLAASLAVVAFEQSGRAREAKAEADSLRDLAEKGRQTAVAKSDTALAKSDTASALRVEAQKSEHATLVRLSIAAALRKKEENDSQTANILALRAFKASDGATLAEAEDALRQTLGPAIRPLNLPFHSGKLIDVVFSPVAKAALTRDSSQIKLWDLQSGHLLRTLRPPRDANDLRFAANGRYFAVNGPSGFAVFPMTEGEPHAIIDDSTTAGITIQASRRVRDKFVASAAAAAFRGAAQQFAMAHWVPGRATWSLTIKSLETGRTLIEHKDLPGESLRFAFSDDGARLAFMSSALPPGWIAIWDVGKAFQVTALNVGGDSTTLIALDKDGSRLATATGGKLSVWSVASKQRLVELAGIAARAAAGNDVKIRRLYFRADGTVGATTVDGEDFSWGVPRDPRAAPDVQPSFAAGIAAMATGQSIQFGDYRVASGPDGRIQIQGETVRNPFTVSGSLRMLSAAFQLDGRRLVTGDLDGAVRVWDVSTQRVATEWFRPRPAEIVASSSDGKMVVSAFGNPEPRELEIWNTALSQRLCGVSGSELRRVLSVAFSPTGDRVAIGDYENGVQIRATNTCQLLAREAAKGSAFGVGFSPDGQRVARSGTTTAILSAQSGAPIATLITGPTLGDIVWSPDGSRIATERREWNVADGATWALPTEGRPTETHGARLIAFSSDGRVLATPDGISAVSLWDRSGKRLAKLYGIAGHLRSLAFTTTGHVRLLVVTDKWTVYEYPVTTEDVVAEAKRRYPIALDSATCAAALRLRTCPDFLLRDK